MGGIFRKSVILMAEHDGNGALGLVLNQPSDALVKDVAPSLSHPSLHDQRFYLGGPVQPEVVTVLAEFEAPGPAVPLIFDSVGFLAPEAPPEVVGRTARARAFAGYAGWGPGQLEAELEEEGSWIVEAPGVDDVFSPDPEGLWRDALRRKGPRFRLLSTMPFDPSSN